MSLSMRLVLALAALVALAACSPFTSRTTSAVAYSPRVEIAAQPGAPSVDWQLTVAKPSAENLLSSPRIAVRLGGGELQVLSGARWADSAPQLLQSLIVRAFEDSGRILGVGRQTGGLRGDFALTLDIRAFEAVYRDSGPPSVHVAFNAKLMGSPGNRVLASRTFEAREPATGRQAPDVVPAFGAALTRSIGELLDWTLEQGEATTVQAEAAATDAS